jgi:glycerol-3-phosphate O-acyltransferase
MGKKSKSSYRFPDVIPDIKDWPLYKFTQNKKQIQNEVIQLSMLRIIEISESNGKSLADEIADAIYHEKNRIKLRPWPVDPEDDYDFWNEIQNSLLKIQVNKEEKEEVKRNQLVLLLEKVVTRYVNEITANFRPGYFKFAKRVIPHGFATLLNKKTISLPVSSFKRGLHLDEKVLFTGHIEKIRKLITKGTVILVPTHFSNLDSLLMGWGIQSLGLPTFHYGAGLNLFNIRLFAFFMNRLGAYKVDRRKKNRIYNETLLDYSSKTIQKGVHALFFPGGTRSRNGAIEQKLKLGLLSTVIDAQRMSIRKNPENPNKIFIVPVVINYHFVLEAPSLINDYLKAAGREKYYFEKDELSTSFKIFKSFIKLLTVSSEIGLSYGKPIDVFGHDVDEEGNSLDKDGNKIDIKGYFLTRGKIERDKQRESEYTRLLSQKIIDEYHRSNLVMTSHLVAFVAFELIKKANDRIDLYDVLRLPVDDIEIEYNYFLRETECLRDLILEMRSRGEVDCVPQFELPIEDVVASGLYHVGVYHAKKTLTKNKAGNIITTDLPLLFYYHNRLTGYDFEKQF